MSQKRRKMIAWGCSYRRRVLAEPHRLQPDPHPEIGCRIGELRKETRKSLRKSLYDHPRPVDRPAAATQARLRGRHRGNSCRPRGAQRRRSMPIHGGYLDWRWHERALERGCTMSINPDAHSTDEIDHTHWGVEMARKGGVPKERVLNCLDLPRFAAFLAERRRRAANGHAPPAKPADARLRSNAGPKATPLKMPGHEARRRGAN
jgi:hypothetical protein